MIAAPIIINAMLSLSEIGFCSSSGVIGAYFITLLLTGYGSFYQPVDGKQKLTINS